jgi:uncharacterized protein YjbI with pentapeptide repeats
MVASKALHSVVVVAVLGTLAASVAGIAGAARASANPNCPTVASGTGLVTPAPTSGVDWSGCDLSGANLNEANLTNVDLAGADLQNVGLFGAQIVNVDLTNTNLENDDIQDSTITDTDLAGADISLAFIGTDTITDLKSGGLTDRDGAPSALPTGWKLDHGYLVGPGDDFSGVDFPALTSAPKLTAWDLTGSTFAGANVTGVDLDNDNLTNVQFAGTNLTNANLYGDNLAGANLQGAILTGNDMTAVESGKVTGTPAELPANWSLRDGYLLGPNAGLVSANLAGVDLTGVDLDHADLYLGTLADANLTDVNFRGAGLDVVDLTGATWSNTICPDGTNSDNDQGTCANNIDDVPPQARPTISGPGINGWYSSATVTWNWSDANGTIDPAKCVTSTATATEGGPAILTANCSNVEGLVGSATASVKIENKGPAVAVTGVTAGLVYAAGHVPAAGCRTTDALSGVAQDATLSVTTTGSHGVGAFTATCAGGLNYAEIPATPVAVKYTVAHGLSAFLAPKSKATVARSAHSFPVAIRLAGIGASLAAKLAAAGGVRVTLSGPGISPVTVKAAWQAKTGTFSARVSIPAKVKTGVNYTVSVRENVGTGLINAPVTGKVVNPETIRFS